MSLVVYNSLTRRKEPFEPVKAPHVGIYTCGPTVYMESHLGHAVGPVIFDTIKRYLVHKGYQVTWVVNITDVDDKIIKRAAELGVPTDKLAREVEVDYVENIRKLGVTAIDHMPHATENIDGIIHMVSGLIDKGFGYAVDGDVYFDISKRDDYGKLSNRKVEDLLEGARLNVDERKRSPVDFALWKAAKPGEPSWPSPWGPGRPGWHIECSVMSMNLLGETFDIHGGGVDLVFPHHENEIAQSESYSGKLFAKYWLHNGLTQVGSEKMSKSLGNMTMLKDLLSRWTPELVRFFLLSTHYRRPLVYSEERIEELRKGWQGFYRLFDRVAEITGHTVFEPVEKPERPASPIGEQAANAAQDFETAMDDDFNTARAIAALFEFAVALNRFISEAKLETPSATETDKRALLEGAAALRDLGRVLGLFDEPISEPEPAAGLDAELIELIIELRNRARKAKSFELADLARDRLAEMGIALEDKPDGTRWRRT